MLVTLTVVVAGIFITGRVARLVMYNYGATRIALAGEKAKVASTPGGKKGRRKFLAPGMSPILPRGGRGGEGLTVSILPMRLF